MFKKESFGSTAAQEKLEQLQGRFAFPKSAKIEEVNAELEKVLFALQMFEDAPKYVITRALYPTVEDGSKLDTARFVVRPSVSEVLEVADLKKVFIIDAGENFFNTFVVEMAQWFDTYLYHKQLQTNLDALNEEVAKITEENEIPFEVRFSLGYDLLDASDEHVVVGLGADVIESLTSLPLFDENFESRVEGYKSIIAETLKECLKPYDIVKVKTVFTKDLGIYSRRNMSKLIRKFVNRKLDFVRVGTGYVDKDNYFAVVDKVALTDEDAKEASDNGVLVIENDKASSKEKEEGKTKIAVSFRVSPFNKEDGTPVEVKLSEVL